MQKTFRLILTLWTLLVLTPRASAVPPPDFIFAVGNQIAYIVSAIAILSTALFSAMFQYLKMYYYRLRLNPLVIVLGILVIGSITASLTYAYVQYQQNREYKEWVQESDANRIEEPIVEETPLQEEVVEVEELTPVGPSLWDEQQHSDLILTNDEFKTAVETDRSDFVILDAREDIENEYGRFPGSIHVRYADLKAGKWSNFDSNKYIYVLCWSGMRGKEVAEFLRSKELVALYLETGTDGWVTSGGKWEGEIKFSSVYPDKTYAIVYDTSTTKEKVADGVVLVDARESAKFTASSPARINIPLMEAPSDSLDSFFNKIPEHSTVITVCDEYINCFMAKLLGVELERRGHIFLGRYNKPWEY